MGTDWGCTLDFHLLTFSLHIHFVSIFSPVHYFLVPLISIFQNERVLEKSSFGVKKIWRNCVNMYEDFTTKCFDGDGEEDEMEDELTLEEAVEAATKELQNQILEIQDELSHKKHEVI